MSKKLFTLLAGLGVLSGQLNMSSRPQRTSTPKKRLSPKGTLFTYSDVFECYAMNQKNADRKHNNWLKNREG